VLYGTTAQDDARELSVKFIYGKKERHMWIRKLLLAAPVLFLASSQAQMQNSIDCNQQNCTFTLNFAAKSTNENPVYVTTGAPYSGQRSFQVSRTLPDGTHTHVETSQPLIYRDSKGRVRTEQPVYRNAGDNGRPVPPDNFTVIEIDDPVAKYQYIFDTVNRVAHRMPYKPGPIEAWQLTPPTPASPPTTQTMPNGATVTDEHLGTQTISGVIAVGWRTTSTGGTNGRGARAIDRSDESWNDPRNGAPLLYKTHDVTSDTTITMLHYSAAEPDPTLFQIPDGFKVVDETGQFQVVHPHVGGPGAYPMSANAGSPAGWSSNWDGKSCTVTYTPATGRNAGMIEWAITGASYSGRESFEVGPRTRPDGTVMPGSTRVGRLVARDSDGRVRTDPAPMMAGFGGRGGGPVARQCSQPELALVEILDPVAGYRMLLDTVAHVAYRVPWQANPRHYQPGEGGQSIGTFTAPNGTISTNEYLGRKLISGITAVGHRSTQTSPPGSYMRNDKTVVQISETWGDPQTGIQLVSKDTGPNGDTTRSIPDYTTNPDPALFKIPEGYKIVDETGPFTFAVLR